jgi:hypothetical protein
VPQASASIAPTREQRLTQIRAALDAALRFPPARASDLSLGPAQLQEAVATEVAFGKIAIDEAGLTGGMQVHLLQPARNFLHQWSQARNPFDVAIQPVMKDIDAVAQLEQEIVAVARWRDEASAQIERQFEANQANVPIKERYEHAKQRLSVKKNEHELREPNMFGYTNLYLLLIVLIGAAEWLINYDTFLFFTGIPAIAAGATLILGFLLAFAAHGFGQILKQWSFRFGRHRDDVDQHSDWRLFGLSLSSLMVVLFAAGGSRYSAAVHALANEGPGNLLPDTVAAVDPMRDVLISLLANLGAWLLGVFISYVSHDIDPEYMAAEQQSLRNERVYNRVRRSVNRQQQTLEAQFQKKINETTTAAQTRAKAVEPERALLAQMKTHDNAIRMALGRVLGANIETYRDLLAKAVGSQKNGVLIVRSTSSGPETYTPFEFKAFKLPIDDIVRSLAA